MNLPEYCNYFGIPLLLKKSMYVMTNYGRLFYDDLTNWMIYVTGFKQSQLHMPIYYKHAPNGSNLVLLYYVDDYLFWYTSE